MKTSNLLREYARRVKKFHDDENGASNTMASVMMLAVAALVVVALIAFGKQMMDWLKQKWSEIAGSSV